MLTLSLFLKAPHAGYVSPLHPVQQKILATLSEMCGVSLSARDCGIDGCSAPNPLMMLESLATGFSRLMNPEDLPRARAEACRRILAAMRAHPDLVAGTERLDTALMAVSGGKIVSKVGAEGNYVAIIPDQDTVIALKAEDGAIRASQAALYALLEKHGLASAEVLDAVRPLCLPVLKNWRGTDVGHIAVRD
jgi:L-asparaginase II